MSLETQSYDDATQVYRAAITRARKSLESSPSGPKDWQSWELSQECGTWWEQDTQDIPSKHLVPPSIVPGPPPLAGSSVQLSTWDWSAHQWTQGWHQGPNGAWKWRS